MAFVETELHKIHLRLEALEAKAAADHLQPASSVALASDVVEPPKPKAKHEPDPEVHKPENHKKEAK